MSHCGQEVIARPACEITDLGFLARFFVGFPANGRTINATELEKILFDFLPSSVEQSFFYKNINSAHLQRSIFLAEDQEYIRKTLKEQKLAAFVADGAILPEQSFFYKNINSAHLQRSIFLAEDQEYIRKTLKEQKLAAFVADGAILPRESGVSQKPMKNAVTFSSPESLRVTLELPTLKEQKLAAFVADGAILPRESGVSQKPMKNAVTFSSPESLRVTLELPHKGKITGMGFVADGAILPRESGVSQKPMKNAVTFSSPESLRVTLELPHKGKITGMGVPCGITLIVGGGYHGKSTLLNALELGVYNHIPGDGREYVITDESALKLRSEDGRFIKDTDISMFINDLPNKKDTCCFSTEDASGSTSQAAGIVEGIESGSRVFLLDEDTSATNFMVRDEFMQKVIRREKEPITPFLERARSLYEKGGISTVLVAGSSGAFFHIADTIIQMDNYCPVDITSSTKELCKSYPLTESHIPPFHMPQSHRVMTKAAPSKTKSRNYFGKEMASVPERLKIKVHGKDGFSLGKQEIDLRYNYPNG